MKDLPQLQRMTKECSNCKFRPCGFVPGSIQQYSCIVRYLIRLTGAARAVKKQRAGEPRT